MRIRRIPENPNRRQASHFDVGHVSGSAPQRESPVYELRQDGARVGRLSAREGGEQRQRPAVGVAQTCEHRRDRPSLAEAGMEFVVPFRHQRQEFLQWPAAADDPDPFRHT